MRNTSFARQLVLILAPIGLLLLETPAATAAPHCFGKPATIVGTPRSDVLRGTGRADVIVGRGGSDHIRGKGGGDRICGGEGSDNELLGGPGRDRISGGSEGDFALGGRGNDILKGGPGWDTMYGDPGSDLLVGGPGGDQLEGGRDDDALIGGPGDDDIGGLADQGDDIGNGGDGDDILRHLLGNDALDGGPGLDLIDAFGDQSGVTIDLAAGISTGAGKGIASLTGIEGVRGTDYDDVLVGDDADNLFTPIYGDDTIDGGPGRDLVNFDRFEDSVFTGLTIDLAAGTAEGAGSDTLIAIEDVQGSEGPDVIRGDSGDNLLMGFYDDDMLEGHAGDDVLDGDLPGDGSDFTEDVGDGGTHIAGDVCVDLAEMVNCESTTLPGRDLGPWIERILPWPLVARVEMSGGRRI
jgi:Ca2+-binding RTX toxin-like protein